MSRVEEVYSIESLRRMARRRVPRAVFDFVDGGAEDEVTLAANRDAFERIRLRPHVLTDVQNPDLSTQILGTKASAPMVVAPAGAAGISWPRADIAIASVAARLGIPYTLSTMATASLEEVAKQAGGRLWFQLYVFQDAAFTELLIHRAADAAYEALVVTLDVPLSGKRERDIRNGLKVPMRPRWSAALDFARHPGWCWQMLRHGQPSLGNLRGFAGNAHGRMSIAANTGQTIDASFDWEALKRIRDQWPRKLLVKGVLRGDVVDRLIEIGVDGIWVSNHGGRQLDGAAVSMDVVPDVVQAVRARVPVLLDSGVRRGVDIVKALAFGAQAVAIGRAPLYGVAAAGQAGADRAVSILIEELRRAMQLCGTPRIADIDSRLL